MSKNTINIDKGNNTIKKSLFSRIAFDKEKYIYKIMINSKLTPDLVDEYEQTLILSYINGVTLRASTMDEEIFYRLANWMISFQEVFYKKTGRYCVLEDPNFGNFIIYEKAIYGVDFEHWSYGDLEQCYAKLLAYVETMYLEEPYDAKYISRKMSVLFEKSGADIKRINILVEIEKDNILKRRKVKKIIGKTTAAILIGGKGSRLGGVDKSKILYKDYTFLDYIEYEMDIFDEIIYSVSTINKENNSLRRFIEDNPKEIGPAGALNALFNSCKSEYLLIWSCDMPFVKKDFIINMFCSVTENTKALIPIDNGGYYPLSAIYSTEIKYEIEKQVHNDTRKVFRLLENIEITDFICKENEKSLRNINTKEDFKKISNIYMLQIKNF